MINMDKIPFNPSQPCLSKHFSPYNNLSLMLCKQVNLIIPYYPQKLILLEANGVLKELFLTQ